MAGTTLLLPVHFAVLVGSWAPIVAVSAVPITRFFTGLAFICYYLAFSPPRWLFRRWQRGEQANYLASTSKREPEERGQKVPDDLVHGAERAVGGALTFVAIRTAPGSSEYVVRASSDDAMFGTRLRPATGLLGRALEAATPVVGWPRECEPGLAERAQALGQTVLVAPVASDEHVWGVLVVVHRRGALFPEDDAALLAELARTGAVALDHAELIAERRARERRAADRRLRDIESRVQLMLDSIKDYGLLLLEADGSIAGWQPGAQHVFGHRAEDVAGQSAAPLFQMAPGEFLAWLDEARAKGHAEREGVCRRADDSTFTGIATVRPLVADSEGAPGFVAVCQDVTHRRLLEDRLRQGQKLEAIGRLAGGVAHDFNNLLMVILGHADWLERGLRDDPRCEEVAGIQEAAERAADLTRRLLAFSRRTVLEPSRIDMTQLVADLLPMLRRLIGDHIEVIDATTTGVPPVLGDVTQLQQVVMNLAVNARDAMPGGGRLTIRTAEVWMEGTDTGGAGRYALLEVTDTGVGMDAETRQLAFEPFFTTKPVGKGTGLGLSTVYGIVQQLGGRIQVESEPSRGTTFRLYFPEMGSAAASGASLSSFESSLGTDTLM